MKICMLKKIAFLACYLICFLLLVSCSNIVSKIPIRQTTINSSNAQYSLSPNGKHFAYETDNGIGVGLTDTWQTVNSLTGTSIRIHSIAWNSDNIHVAAIDYDGKLIVWNSQTGNEIVSFSSQSLIDSELIWVSESVIMAINQLDYSFPSVLTMHVWDIHEQHHLSELTLGYRWAYHDKQIATIKNDDYIEIYNLITREKNKTINVADYRIEMLTWSSDGLYLVGIGSGDGKPDVVIWDVVKDETVIVFFNKEKLVYRYIYEYIWQRNFNQLILLADKTYLIDIPTKAVVKTYENKFEKNKVGVEDLQWSYDGQYLAAIRKYEQDTVGNPRQIVNFGIWDGETQELLYAPDHNMGIKDLQWIPNTHSLLITDRSGTHIFSIKP